MDSTDTVSIRPNLPEKKQQKLSLIPRCGLSLSACQMAKGGEEEEEEEEDCEFRSKIAAPSHFHGMDILGGE